VTALDLISKNIATGRIEERLSDVAQRIVAARASHCVVLDENGTKFVGVIKLAHVAIHKNAGNRILGDLTSSVWPVSIEPKESATVVADLFDTHDLSEAVVVDNGTGDYLGLITAESVLKWSRRELKRSLVFSRSSSPFPDTYPSDEAAHGRAKLPMGPIRGTILLVEDHEPSRTTLARLLIRRNYRVVACGSISEALAQARIQKFSFVISDIGLPDGTGYQLIDTLQREHSLSGIAVSGLSVASDAGLASSGFSSHLKKPIDIHQLESALDALAGANDR
jgi:CheY-like chemotaxis protein/CBS domain-containing protein